MGYEIEVLSAVEIFRIKKLVIFRENPDIAAATRKGQIVHAPESPLSRRYGVKFQKEFNTQSGYSLDYA